MDKYETQIDRLREVFDTLNRSTEKLAGGYSRLESEMANIGLNVEESRGFLSDILDNINCGVVVTGGDGAVLLSNPEARILGADDPALVERWRAELAGAGAGHPGAKRKLTWETSQGRELAVSASGLTRSDNKAAGMIFVIEDVTEIKRLRIHAGRAGRLAAIGEMAAGMAHEIRNPLGGMDLFASLLRRELAGDKDKLRLLAHVTTGIQTINNVISNVLMFTREPKPDKKEFDPVKLAGELLEFAAYIFEQNNIELRTDFPNEPVTLEADQNMIRQVLLNLIHNAVAAMPDGGRFTMTIRVNPGVGDGRVEIVCSDTGPGVPENIREKIFDPFFTTKDTGAGLGLSIILQIAQAHGGYVDTLDAKSGGASFIVSLPRKG